MRNQVAGAAVLCALLASGASLPLQGQQTWQANMGAQSKDMGTQAMAFLPNELWIHVGDSITWTSQAAEMHTATLLMTAQPLPRFQVGCPGFAMSPAIFDGIHCLSTPTMTLGQSFTIKFNAVGNFSLVCLVHPHMTGVIHVLATTAALPHDQAFYSAEAAEQTKKLLTDTDAMKGHDGMGDMGGAMDDMWSTRVIPGGAKVTAGVGEMNGTGGGFQSTAVMRFLKGTITVHAGDTVEWRVKDPATPHTVTFGTPPPPSGDVPPSSNVTVDADGARHATLHFVGENVHSGLLSAAPENQTGVPQSPPGTTVFRATFLNPGTYDYQCALHDELGMEGTVIVLP